MRESLEPAGGLRRLEESEWRLRQSEERYALAMAGSNEGHWDLDLESGRLYVSERLQSILGTGRGDEVTDRKSFEKRLVVHPDDIARVWRAQKAHVKGETPYYKSEYRARCGDAHGAAFPAAGRGQTAASRCRRLGASRATIARHTRHPVVP